MREPARRCAETEPQRSDCHPPSGISAAQQYCGHRQSTDECQGKRRDQYMSRLSAESPVARDPGSDQRDDGLVDDDHELDECKDGHRAQDGCLG